MFLVDFLKNVIDLTPRVSSVVTGIGNGTAKDDNEGVRENIHKSARELSSTLANSSSLPTESSDGQSEIIMQEQEPYSVISPETENSLSSSNPASGSIPEVKNKRGRITLLDNCMPVGVIDNQYEFQHSNWFDLNLKRGQEIIYSAFYEAENAKWLVTDVKQCLSEDQLIINERSRFRTIVYKVKELRGQVQGNGYDVIVGPGGSGRNRNKENNDSFISLYITHELLPKDYEVKVGDWLTIKLEASLNEDGIVDEDVSTAKIRSVNWTDKMLTVGEVKKYSYHLCVDGIIAYTPDVVKGRHKLLNLFDKVEVLSVSSDQDNFPKRALSVKLITPSKNLSHQSQLDSEWEDEDESSFPLDREFDELFSEKCGIRITPSRFISFGKVKIGDIAETSVKIQNTLVDSIDLKRVQIGNFQDVCKFQFYSDESFRNENHSSDTHSNCPMITVLPDRVFSFKVSCSPVQLGRTKELCLFDFGDFEIGRWLTVTCLPNDDAFHNGVLSLNGDSMERRRDFLVMKNSTKQKLADLVEQQNMPLIRGPSAVRPAFFIANRIHHFSVPQDLRMILKNEDTRALNSLYPNTNWEVLDAENYARRFHVAIWFEEIENDLARRRSDLYNVVMETCGGNELMFRVPGLKEINPPVLQGDPIKCLNPQNPKQYSGHISKLVYPDDGSPICFVKFSDDFYRFYKKEGMTIQFGLGRTPYKRAHYAVDRAMEYLGVNWLFPQEFDMKPPRIQFVEDEQDNLEPPVTNQILIEKNLATTLPSAIHENGAEITPLASRNRVDIRAKNIFSFDSNVQKPQNSSNVKLRWFNPLLNEEQRNAVRRILRGQGRPLPYIIFGPPGTGKTVTVVEAILQIYFREETSRILVTVPSNAGADLIAEHLIKTNRFVPGDLVRLNGFTRSNVSLTDSIADFCVDGENLESVAKHRLIISTVTTAGQFFHLNLNTGHFSHVFVDEAGYCTEPEALIAAVLTAVNKEGQLILAGDPKQLGPVLMSDLTITEVLEKSFLERLMKTHVYSRNELLFPTTKYNPAVLTKLVKCYRAHETLLKLPSQKFYSDELVSLAKYEDAYELCQKLSFLPKKGVPLLFHGIQGTCFKDNNSSNSQSWYNLAEVSQIVHYVRELKNNGVKNADIGIITPYRKQVEKIRQTLQILLLENDIPKVASVQEFQGGERKVIIISTVRTEANDDIIRTKLKENRFEFLCSAKRFNVAVTRAKGLMIILGDPHLLFRLPDWTDYLQYAVQLGVYVGCDKPRQLEPKRLRDFLRYLPSSHNSTMSSSSSFNGSNNSCMEGSNSFTKDNEPDRDFDDESSSTMSATNEDLCSQNGTKP